MDHWMLDDDGNAVMEPDLIKWARWFETANRKLAQDIVGAVRVSTVFLGLDHGFVPEEPPILWETMIFGGEHDLWQDRYASKADALAGHAAALKMVQQSRVERN